MDWLRSVLFRLLRQKAERGLRGPVDVQVHEHHVSAPSLREMSSPENLAGPGIPWPVRSYGPHRFAP